MKNTLVGLCIFFVGITFYTLTLRGIYGNVRSGDIKNKLDQAARPFELSPERGRFILTMSLAESRSFALTKELADAAYPDVGYYQGRFYIYFPPGVSLLALPFYEFGKPYNLSQVASFLSVSVFAAFSLILLFKIGREIFKLPFWLSLLSPFIFGFASTSWSYAITLYQHHITAFLMLLSFYSVWRYSKDTRFSWIWGGVVWIAYGYSLFVDYPNAFLLLPVMVYFLFSALKVKRDPKGIRFNLRLSIITTSILFVMSLGLHAFYNQVNFGSWKRVSGSLVGYKHIVEKKLLEEKSATTIASEQAKKSPVKFFEEEKVPTGFSILLFSRDRGFFLFSPIFIFALLGLYTMRKKIDGKLATLIGLIGVNLFLYSSWGDPWGGWAFGPRYLIPSMAILSIFVSLWLFHVKNKLLGKLLMLPFFIYSSAIALLGALTTNQVPPKVEADYLKMKYNFLLNIDYFTSQKSGSYLYNNFFSQYYSFQQYYLAILLAVLFLFLFVLFVLPIFAKNES